MKLRLITTVLVLNTLPACSKGSSTSTLAHEEACLVSAALVSDSAPAYDFVFPDGLSQYTTGTRVLQKETGRVYQCKGFPYTVYCREHGAGLQQFEPGIGPNWMAAWDVK